MMKNAMGLVNPLDHYVVIDVDGTKDNLKMLILSSGYTVRDIQYNLGLGSPQAVYHWLSHNRTSLPSLDNLFQLAELFSCSIEDIIVTSQVKRGRWHAPY